MAMVRDIFVTILGTGAIVLVFQIQFSGWYKHVALPPPPPPRTWRDHEIVCVMPVVNRVPDYLHHTIDAIATACPTLHVYDADPGHPYTHRGFVCSLDNVMCTRLPTNGTLGRYLERAFDPVEKRNIPARFAPFMEADGAAFVRWRTREGYTMHYALWHALATSPDATHFVWLQDDVTIPANVSWRTVLKGDVTCLRTGKLYCGATAYGFSRAFATSLLPVLDTYLHILPVDWIIDMHSAGRATRVGIASHLGKVSTNARMRVTDA